MGPASPTGARAETIAGTNGFAVKRVPDLASAEGFLTGEGTQLTVLDSGPNGVVDFSTCYGLACLRAGPLLVISDHDDETDRILALELGAFDCISPACGDREVLARIRALARRSWFAAAAGIEGSSLFFSGLQLNLERRELRSADGRMLLLTRTEFDLLHLFLRSAGQVLRSDDLRVAAGGEAGEDRRNIAVKIFRLRRRLEALGGVAATIRTVYGVGYMLDAAVSRLPSSDNRNVRIGDDRTLDWVCPPVQPQP